MKIELKSIKFSEAMSEETKAFTADLYINGKKVGYCKNTGQGGCTDYYGIEKAYPDIIKEAEAYCKAQPDIDYGTFTIKNNLEHTIDLLFENWLKAKERKKLEKRMETGILWGKPNAGTYTYLNYKIPLVGLSKTAPKMLQDRINQIKRDHCIGGVVILNTNLEALGVNV